VTVAVPKAAPVKVTAQLAAPTTVVANNEQLAPTEPTVVFDEMKLTVPVGVVGLVDVSVTVAVHVEVASGRIKLGAQ
jgi:hypothetical protein